MGSEVGGEVGGEVDRATGATLFDTEIGRCGIAWRGPVVTAVQIPEDDDRLTLRRLTAKVEADVSGGVAAPSVPAPPPPPIVEVIGAVVRLLQGEHVDLNFVTLDLDSVGPFERAVYEVTRSIDSGQTLTYGQVAKRIDQPGAAQAVGRALGANPFPIVVPCHRVLGADGRMVGFSANGGVATKRRMLLIEGSPAVPPSLFD